LGNYYKTKSSPTEAQNDMKRIDLALLDATSQQAKQLPRKRKNHNFHEQMEDTLHRMLNALEMNTYVRPHKHEKPDKREAFIVLRGRLAVVLFDENGQITDHEILDSSEGRFGVEIAPATWHTLICLRPDTVIYEVKDGPWEIGTDKNFAPWSPEEGSPTADQYVQKLIGELGLK
jgi:cupin fold WbuC family metalloprotein